MKRFPLTSRAHRPAYCILDISYAGTSILQLYVCKIISIEMRNKTLKWKTIVYADELQRVYEWCSFLAQAPPTSPAENHHEKWELCDARSYGAFCIDKRGGSRSDDIPSKIWLYTKIWHQITYVYFYSRWYAFGRKPCIRGVIAKRTSMLQTTSWL